MIRKRKCQGCAKLFEPSELFKITKTKEGELFFEPNSKILGRSTYVCKNPECIKIFLKKKRLRATLKFNNEKEISKIEEILKQHLKD